MQQILRMEGVMLWLQVCPKQGKQHAPMRFIRAPKPIPDETGRGRADLGLVMLVGCSNGMERSVVNLQGDADNGRVPLRLRPYTES